jgi:tight adherence protein B
MLILAVLVAGLAMMLLALAVSGGRERKAASRRLDLVKTRHAAANTVEVQLRRIAAQRSSKLDDTFHRLIPNPELLRKRIERTGREWSLGRYASFCAVLMFATWTLLAMRGFPLLLTFLGGVLIGIGLPFFALGYLAKKRIAKFVLRFPDAIELLVRGLRSGLPISETIGVVGSEIPDPVGSEFRAVADKMRIGRSMEDALQETADRIGTPETQFFVITLAIQRETGGNLAETLSNLADVLRKRMQMKLKVKAMSSESKASAYIIGALPFLVFAMILWVSPNYMDGFFSDQRLMMAAAAGGIWMLIGVFVMAKMISFEI